MPGTPNQSAAEPRGWFGRSIVRQKGPRPVLGIYSFGRNEFNGIKKTFGFSSGGGGKRDGQFQALALPQATDLNYIWCCGIVRTTGAKEGSTFVGGKKC